MVIFSDFLERSVEIFMDDFSVFEDSFKECLDSLEEVLEKCEETQLVLNWEKCHFMVKEGIVLEHKISNAGLEVDPMKIDVVSKLSPPLELNHWRAFWDTLDSTEDLSKDFPKSPNLSITCYAPINHNFDEKCNQSFQTLKDVLISALSLSR